MRPTSPAVAITRTKTANTKKKTKTSPAVPILPNGRPEDATMARDQGGGGEDSQGEQDEEHPSTLDFWARPIWRQLLLPNFHESQHCTSVTELCPLQRRRCLSILPSLNPMWTDHLSWVIILFCAGHLMELSMFALFICVNTSCIWCHFVTERTFGNFHGRRKRGIAVQIYLGCRSRRKQKEWSGVS